MPYFKTAHSEEVEIYYQDMGAGKPVIFIHGWPLNSNMWEYQLGELPQHFRCIAYDRRGFGCSDKPWGGYDYDTMAKDLAAIIDHLRLSEVTLVGFSMGGGEVVRYLSNHGSSKISKIVLISAVTPFMLKTDDNPDGFPASVFAGFADSIKKDRPAFLANFVKYFFGVGLVSHPVSSELLEWAHGLALESTQKATLACITAFSSTDFREDCRKVSVPALIIHGDTDKTIPIEISGHKAQKLIPGSQLHVYEGAPHGLFYTHKDQLNQDLIDFIS